MNDIRTSFTDWDAGLEHHGIKGMHWGVRRYQNSDGTLTILGKSRYGENGTGASAKKMQRDFNNLDKGYANVVAENAAANKRANRLATRMMVRTGKKTGNDASKVKSFMDTDRKIQKDVKKLKSAAQKMKLTNDQMKSIENLQFRILAKAAEAGYTVNSKPVVRIGNTAKQRVSAMLAAGAIGGGALGGAIIGTALGMTGTRVDGQKVRISKRGNGNQQVVNYSNGNRTKGLTNVVKAGFQDAVRGQNYTRYMTPEERRRKGL